MGRREKEVIVMYTQCPHITRQQTVHTNQQTVHTNYTRATHICAPSIIKNIVIKDTHCMEQNEF